MTREVEIGVSRARGQGEQRDYAEEAYIANGGAPNYAGMDENPYKAPKTQAATSSKGDAWRIIGGTVLGVGAVLDCLLPIPFAVGCLWGFNNSNLEVFLFCGFATLTVLAFAGVLVYAAGKCLP